MKTTRQHILEYLEIKGAATTLDISRALHLTPANIRRHMAILLEEGVVEVVEQRAQERAGRPSRLFAPARRLSAHNLDGLAEALLHEMAASIPPHEQSVFLKKVARRLAEAHKPVTRNFSQRLAQAVQGLNAMNYNAHWEARPDAPRLILGHCPYAAVLPKHPELCSMDAAMLEELLGAPVTQIARLERTPQGLRQCIFRVGEKGRM